MHKFRDIIYLQRQLKSSQIYQLRLNDGTVQYADFFLTLALLTYKGSCNTTSGTASYKWSLSSCLVPYLISKLSEKQNARCMSSVCKSDYIQEATINICGFSPSSLPQTMTNGLCSLQCFIGDFHISSFKEHLIQSEFISKNVSFQPDMWLDLLLTWQPASCTERRPKWDKWDRFLYRLPENFSEVRDIVLQ